MKYELTPQDYRNMADAIEAHKAGRPVEFQCIGVGIWNSNDRDDGRVNGLDRFGTDYIYRPAPEPVTRPWSKPEDVPGPVCWIRPDNGGPEMLIDCVFTKGIAYSDASTRKSAHWGIDLKRYEHSTDRINWKPCVVEVSE